jgi:hypothetical protein
VEKQWQIWRTLVVNHARVVHFYRFGETEKLESPAAKLVMGQPVSNGTGFFSLFQPLVT